MKKSEGKREGIPNRDPDLVDNHKYHYPDNAIPNEVLAILPDSEGRPADFQMKAAELLAELNKAPHVTPGIAVWNTGGFGEKIKKLREIAEKGVSAKGISEGEKNAYENWQPADLLALAEGIEQHPLYLAKIKEGERRAALEETIHDWRYGDNDKSAVFRQTWEVPTEVTTAVADQIVTRFVDALLASKRTGERFSTPQQLEGNTSHPAFQAVEQFYGDSAYHLTDSRAEDTLELRQARDFENKVNDLVNQDPRMIALLKEAAQLQGLANRAYALKSEAHDLTLDALVQQGLDSDSVKRKIQELLVANGLDERSLTQKRRAAAASALQTVEEKSGEKLSDYEA
ncbi:TPA: hypothetical protein DEP96_02040 [Candidatus Uhrbacteria bacterium]|nr:hypothetical protein [Candidatus Uhrbacteria bacterium]